MCDAHEIDPRDLVSIVCISILQANDCDSAYEKSRGSVSRYIRTVAVSRLANLVDKQRRRARHEVVSMHSDPALKEAEDTASSACPDARVAIAGLLPRLVAQAKQLEGDWRADAVEWVAAGTPTPSTAARAWRCSVNQARERLEWARELLENAVEDLVGILLPTDEPPARRNLPAYL